MTKKLSQEELQKLKDLQAQGNQIAVSLGEIEIQKAILEGNKNDLLKKLADLQESQNKLAKELQENYGEGNINLETGEFTTPE
jgi:hypothetical protein